MSKANLDVRITARVDFGELEGIPATAEDLLQIIRWHRCSKASKDAEPDYYVCGKLFPVTWSLWCTSCLARHVCKVTGLEPHPSGAAEG